MYVTSSCANKSIRPMLECPLGSCVVIGLSLVKTVVRVSEDVKSGTSGGVTS